MSSHVTCLCDSSSASRRCTIHYAAGPQAVTHAPRGARHALGSNAPELRPPALHPHCTETLPPLPSTLHRPARSSPRVPIPTHPSRSCRREWEPRVRRRHLKAPQEHHEGRCEGGVRSEEHGQGVFLEGGVPGVPGRARFPVPVTRAVVCTRTRAVLSTSEYIVCVRLCIGVVLRCVVACSNMRTDTCYVTFPRLSPPFSTFLRPSPQKGISDPYCVCLVGFAVPNYTDLGGGAKKTKKLSLEEYPDRQRTPTVWDNADPVWNVRCTSHAAPRPTQCLCSHNRTIAFFLFSFAPPLRPLALCLCVTYAIT